MEKETVSNKKMKKDDMELSTTIIITQTIVCCILMALVIISKIFLPDTFEGIRMRYMNEVIGNFDYNQIVENTISVLNPAESKEKNNIENNAVNDNLKDTTVKNQHPTDALQSIPDDVSDVTFDEADLDIPQTAYVPGESPLEAAFLNFSSENDVLIENKDELQLEEVITGASFTEYKVSQMGVLPTSGRISSQYGFRNDPFTGAKKFHGGLDIATATGTPISAAYDGRVIKAANLETGYGKHIVISHGNGMITIYGHCSKLLVEQGTVVRAGEIIAEVGSTGNSTGPHLHFEVRIDGIKVSPLNMIDVSKLG